MKRKIQNTLSTNRPYGGKHLILLLLLLFLYACGSDDKLARDKQENTYNQDSPQNMAARPDTVKNLVKPKAEITGHETVSQPTKIFIPESEITSCDKTAEAIFLSSEKVQQLLKAKNTKYSMEYKPGDVGNPTKRYWFWVFASSAKSSHSETYGRFQVDPISGQLYENDLVSDTSTPIPSNTGLKKYLGQFCGRK